MGKMKQETPPCDGCTCRDDNITRLQHENAILHRDFEHRGKIIREVQGQLDDLRARFDQEIRFYTKGKGALYESEINRQRDLIKTLWELRPSGAATNAIYEANRSIIDDAMTERDCSSCAIQSTDKDGKCDGCSSWTKYHNWEQIK